MRYANALKNCQHMINCFYGNYQMKWWCVDIIKTYGITAVSACQWRHNLNYKITLTAYHISKNLIENTDRVCIINFPWILIHLTLIWVVISLFINQITIRGVIYHPRMGWCVLLSESWIMSYYHNSKTYSLLMLFTRYPKRALDMLNRRKIC